MQAKKSKNIIFVLKLKSWEIIVKRKQKVNSKNNNKNNHYNYSKNKLSSFILCVYIYIDRFNLIYFNNKLFCFKINKIYLRIISIYNMYAK